ncbi:hypothetical protein BC834DRAFT_908941 [Gloeopeniophorella convolvens]|nr:hypothetical protein BC834DRAFT_908941 [Gloeopeniophorella convolvens]
MHELGLGYGIGATKVQASSSGKAEFGSAPVSGIRVMSVFKTMSMPATVSLSQPRRSESGMAGRGRRVPFLPPGRHRPPPYLSHSGSSVRLPLVTHPFYAFSASPLQHLVLPHTAPFRTVSMPAARVLAKVDNTAHVARPHVERTPRVPSHGDGDFYAPESLSSHVTCALGSSGCGGDELPRMRMDKDPGPFNR